MAETVPAGADQPVQFIHTFGNGLTLLAESIPAVRSAAMTLLVPAGAATDVEGQAGATSVLSDWILRGAGTRDSRGLTEFLDGLGVQRSTQAETVFMRFSASLIGKNLMAVLPVYADIVQRPMLPADGFEPARDLALQQLDAIEDEPSQKLSLLLRERHFPYPYGRPTVGRREELKALTAKKLQASYERRFTPTGAILAVAGSFDWAQLLAAVGAQFGGWKPVTPVLPVERQARRGNAHIRQKTNQSQIGLAWDAVADSHPNSILLQTALNVLSGGMGARLFTEIREKQGLCYSVNAGYGSLKTQGAVFGYAGTSPDRAQRTLDSFLVELDRLTKGITQDELDRAKIGMKSRVIMQGESSGARAGAIAYDFYHRGRTRTLDEVRELIEGVTLERVNAFLAANPVPELTVVTIGPVALKVGGSQPAAKKATPAKKKAKAKAKGKGKGKAKVAARARVKPRAAAKKAPTKKKQTKPAAKKGKAKRRS